ncbi:MAG: SUMF1/EgtB/PvdO family nonheme iron enzyme [Anaerolineales bacterium]|nr:SUMF1/EgtB/PvdO family nonheme iron enzyme [Anaerolineales bacterium]
MLRRVMVTLIAFAFLSGCGTPSTTTPDITPAPSPTNLPPKTTVTPEVPTETPLPTNTSFPPTPTPILPRNPELGQKWTRPTDGMTIVFIPAGEFEMGSTEDVHCSHLDERPRHTVYLDDYWIDQTPVTNAHYQICVDAGACPPPTDCDWGDPTYGDESKEDHPVVCLSWDEARAYCEWVGGTLPTEAQWEKAARGTDLREYPWGDTFDTALCNTDESAIGETTPVGFYSPIGDSPYGLVDMAGNVWEWVIDWYDIGYYPESPKNNPQGPQGGRWRSLRGGSYYGDYCNARTAYRYYDVPYGSGAGVGFRCVVPSS